MFDLAVAATPSYPYGWSCGVFAAKTQKIDPRTPFAAAGVSVVLALLLFLVTATGRTVSSEFIPSTQTGDVSMTLTYPVGTPLWKTQATIDRIERHILAIPGVASTFTRSGSKPAGWGSTVGGNVGRLHASMDKKRRGETNRAIAEMRKLGYLAPGGAVFTVAGDGGNGRTRSITRCPGLKAKFKVRPPS